MLGDARLPQPLRGGCERWRSRLPEVVERVPSHGARPGLRGRRHRGAEACRARGNAGPRSRLRRARHLLFRAGMATLVTEVLLTLAVLIGARWVVNGFAREMVRRTEAWIAFVPEEL